MDLKNCLSEVFRQMSWADAAAWQSVLKTPQSGEDDRIKRLLYHMHATQHAFLSVWEDRPLEIPDPASFPDLITIAKWGQGFHKEAAEFLSGIDEKELPRVITVPWTYMVEEKLGKKPGEVTLEGSMIQVALHSTHHRGQVTARVRELGGEPPLIDYIGWLWVEKPVADWDFIFSMQGKEETAE